MTFGNLLDPAVIDNIITVGAADGAERADYSSYGEGLDLLAPGQVNQMALTGTSLSTPK